MNRHDGENARGHRRNDLSEHDPVQAIGLNLVVFGCIPNLQAQRGNSPIV
jgi:hypothetical protein